MMDLRRRFRERRVRREERVRRAAPVRKMLSWLRERVGGEAEGGCRVSGLDIVGRSGRWRNAMGLSFATMEAFRVPLYRSSRRRLRYLL